MEGYIVPWKNSLYLFGVHGPGPCIALFHQLLPPFPHHRHCSCSLCFLALPNSFRGCTNPIPLDFRISTSFSYYWSGLLSLKQQFYTQMSETPASPHPPHWPLNMSYSNLFSRLQPQESNKLVLVSSSCCIRCPKSSTCLVKFFMMCLLLTPLISSFVPLSVTHPVL